MFNSNCNTASVPLVANIDGNGNNGAWGDGGWLWIIVVFALLFGWGGNGFGGFGGGNFGRDGYPCATQADVRAAVDQQTLISKLDQQTYGLADTFTALNNTLNSNFRGIDNAICTLGYQNQQGFNEVAHQISDCCCGVQRSIDGVNYNLATQTNAIQNAMCNNTRDIIDNQNANSRAVLDFLVNDKLATLQAENQNLKLKASQAEQNNLIIASQQAQTNELIRRLGADCPVNAYVVQPPTPVTFPVNCCGQFSGYGNYENNNTCGCC